MFCSQKLKEKQVEELKKLQLEDLSQFTIKGSENEWSSALAKNPKGILSLKRYVLFNAVLRKLALCFFVLAVKSEDSRT